MKTNMEIQNLRTQTFIKNNGSLADIYPNSVKFWHPFKNGILTPYDVTAHAKTVVWWYCDTCGYEWQASILTRGKAKCCPVCCGQKVVTGINDFATMAPDIALEWDYEKNNDDYSPLTVASHSHKKGWWTCRYCGYSYKSTFENRFLGEGCKICGYRIVGEKVTDRALKSNGSLASTHSQLLEDWDYGKNININPNNIPVMSRQSVWWKCHVCGFEWFTAVYSRTYGNGCPECARNSIKSKLQTYVENYISYVYQYNVLHEHKCNLKIRNPKTGVLLPYDNEVVDLRLMIEVHGEQHYRICGFTKMCASHNNTTPEQAFEDQQYRDKIKKDYALSQGYEYLEIPYTAEKNDQYKQLIDDKIHEILNLTNITK